MLQKLRANELALYVSAIFFFIAWVTEQTRINHVHSIVPYPIDSSSDVASSILAQVLTSTFYILPTLIVLGGLPLLLAACWQNLKGKNLRALLLCLLALVSPIVVVIIPVAILYTMAYLRASSPILGNAWVILAIFTVSMGLSVAFIVSTIKRVEPNRYITHYALYIALGLTVVMLSSFVTLLIATLPTIFNVSTAPGDEMAYAARHILLLLVMVATTGTAIYSLFHAFQVKQSEQIAA